MTREEPRDRPEEQPEPDEVEVEVLKDLEIDDDDVKGGAARDNCQATVVVACGQVS